MVALPGTPPLVVLAGGLGSRMLHHTRSTPKALLPVGGTPFLTELLQAFRDRGGIVDVLLCTGHMADQVRDEIGDGSRLGLRVTHSPEPEPLGPIGALRYAADLPDAFLLTYCDVLPTIDPLWFAERARSCGRPAAMAVGPAPTAAEANVRVRDDRVTAYAKNPGPAGATDCDRGLLALEKSTLDRHPGRDEREFYGSLARGGELAAVPVRDPVVDIGTADRYETYLRVAETS
ncbi:NTP transferase domain-containing protein [Streptomyces sp.]|uniref:NTP transferase domain-containing protein n=1 Tax=Streptomyces sp. TaxID=1931 RepID=UPI002D4AD191|nr:NTP transferase domain-containing protein [Streptomyces sp.]HZF86896.1 NTP transferase domain-containing protein [Streptomyces sp.]